MNFFISNDLVVGLPVVVVIFVAVVDIFIVFNNIKVFCLSICLILLFKVFCNKIGYPDIYD